LADRAGDAFKVRRFAAVLRHKRLYDLFAQPYVFIARLYDFIVRLTPLFQFFAPYCGYSPSTRGAKGK